LVRLSDEVWRKQASASLNDIILEIAAGDYAKTGTFADSWHSQRRFAAFLLELVVVMVSS